LVPGYACHLRPEPAIAAVVGRSTAQVHLSEKKYIHKINLDPEAAFAATGSGTAVAYASPDAESMRP
jgi:hypothetical protein